MNLRIFADRSLAESGYVSMLYPFWGTIPEPAGSVDTGRFDAWAREGKKFMTLVASPADADAVILPFEWRARAQWGEEYDRRVEVVSRLAAEAKRAGKPLVIFFNNDSDEEIPVDGAVIFRTSFYRSRRAPNEFALPGWSVDFLERYRGGKLEIREKSELPTVGYCGYVDYDFDSPATLLMYALRRLVGREIKTGARLRGRAIRGLRRETGVRLNFTARTDFGGGTGEKRRREYVDNMFGSDYGLVTRGAGNFSYRLYEMLSCGRIPVIVDTDCVLPYDHLIDWKKYSVWVDAEDLERAGEKVAEFHAKLSSEAFRELQLSVRRLYEEWLSPVGFYANLWRCIPGAGEAK